jgi:mannitol/fructose-specific phosphotransferase system IIA component (Ntr-type)
MLAAGRRFGMSTGLLSAVFDTSLFIPDLRYQTLEPVLGEMAGRAARSGHVCDARLLRTTLAMREKAGPTGIGKGVAVPHARSIHVFEPCMVFGRSTRGIPWSETDDEAVRLVLLMLSPAEVTSEAHVEWVARGVSILRTQRPRQRLLGADDFDAVSAVLAEAIA